MKYLIIAALLAVTPTTQAEAAAIPYYNIEQYCSSLKNLSGGSYTLEYQCRMSERDARTRLSRQTVAYSILGYCTRMLNTMNMGSYTILEGCVNNETSSARRMGY